MRISEKFVITINRELGSGGKTVAKLLAERLGVPYYDRAHLQSLEDKEGLNDKEIERLKGKKRTWWPDLKKIVELDGGFAVSIYDNLPNYPVKDKNDTDEKFRTEQEILKGIVDAESCVVAGRCSFVTFKDHPNHLNIWIQSPMECRVERVMKKKGIASKEEAEKFITEVDKLCEDYVKRHTGATRYDPRNYDLVVSMNGRTEEEAVELILNYIGSK
ncbi:MAG: AAA family ATPase [Bacteroidaceae bacterium]